MSPSTDGAIGGSMRRSIVASSLGKVVELVTLVALATIVPRALGPADYGRFAVVLTVVTMVSLALTLGGPTLMTRYVPAAPPDERVPLALALGRRLLVTRAAMLSIGAVAALERVGQQAAAEWIEGVAQEQVAQALDLAVDALRR